MLDWWRSITTFILNNPSTHPPKPDSTMVLSEWYLIVEPARPRVIAKPTTQVTSHIATPHNQLPPQKPKPTRRTPHAFNSDLHTCAICAMKFYDSSYTGKYQPLCPPHRRNDRKPRQPAQLL